MQLAAAPPSEETAAIGMALTEDARVTLSSDKQTRAAALVVSQSVRRPGTFFMFRALTRQGVTPNRSTTS